MSDWIWIYALIVVAYAISKATDTIVYVAALRYSYLREVRPPRTLAEFFGARRNCDDEEDE